MTGEEVRAPRDAAPDGLTVVDKPAGMTSHDVVARVRRLARTRRVGHAGTLDPMATGVLVVGVGRATRMLGYLTGHDKSYRATIRLGQSTVTDDAEGEVTATAATDHVTDEAIRRGLADLTGPLQQVPSAVSAIKVDGRRAYRRVRAGEQVELAPRAVTVHALELHEVRRVDALIDLDVTVTCSAGTYVRAIARDLGRALGTGGHLTALRRTAAGPFTLAEAVPLDQLADRGVVTLPLAEAARRVFPAREVTAAQAQALAHGRPLPAVGLPGPYAAFAPDGRVLAILSERGGLARPEAVLAPA